MKKLRKGDKVIITQGKDKGKKSEITKVLPKKNMVIVKGVSIYKKHVKSTQDKPGGIIELERPLHTSKVMVLDETGKPTRIGIKRTKSGVTRISKKTGKTL